MRVFKKTMMAFMAVLIGAGLASCTEANEYEDARTGSPTWVDDYTDSLDIPRPETLAHTTWVRGTGLNVNVYGEEVQGFVESLEFISEDSVIVKMSEGTTSGTWTDDSNTEVTPYYEYEYLNEQHEGQVTIKKVTYDEKDVPYKKTILVGVAVSGDRDIMTIMHYGDTPAQTYLVRQ